MGVKEAFDLIDGVGKATKITVTATTRTPASVNPSTGAYVPGGETQTAIEGHMSYRSSGPSQGDGRVGGSIEKMGNPRFHSTTRLDVGTIITVDSNDGSDPIDYRIVQVINPHSVVMNITGYRRYSYDLELQGA